MRNFAGVFLLALLPTPWGLAFADICWGNLPPTNPDQVYVRHGNGTVTDTSTGLMWKACAEGQAGSACSGEANTFTWAEALSWAEATVFGGHDDWRLPNVKELSGLVEECRFTPAININFFPNTPNAEFWSSSPQVQESFYTPGAWWVDFYIGYTSHDPRELTAHVRLVRDPF